MPEDTPPKGPTPPGLVTPSGSRISHPFYDGFIRQLGHTTVTPGLFSQQMQPTSQSAFTPSRAAPVPFVWSPEVQGDLFPTEIDENPMMQVKLQQMLDEEVRAPTIRLSHFK